jgi:Ni/Co efflux regulator RcnB
MTEHSGTKIKLVMTAVAALFAAVTTASYADDSVKTGGPTYKPGREIDEGSPVKSGSNFDKPGRSIDADKKAVKTGDEPYKPGRALNEEKRKKKHKKPVEQ